MPQIKLPPDDNYELGFSALASAVHDVLIDEPEVYKAIMQAYAQNLQYLPLPAPEQDDFNSAQFRKTLSDPRGELLDTMLGYKGRAKSAFWGATLKED